MLNSKEKERQTLIAQKNIIENLAANLENLVETTFDEIDDEVFWDMLEALDSYNGCLDCDRWYSMDELDDFLYGKTPTEILSECREIDVYDDYFKCGIYGWESGDREYDSCYRDYDIYSQMMERLEYSDLDWYLDDDTFVKIKALQEVTDTLQNLENELNDQIANITAELLEEANNEETKTE